MLHTLYLLCIAPLEFLMRLTLEWGFSCTHSWGWSLVLLSFVVNTALLPISNWAERQREKERELRRGMARREAMLRECFRGQARFALLSALRRVSGYDWRFSLRGGMGLLLQLPFFIAAYHLLSSFDPLRGQAFGLLPDLGAPDGLLSGVNLLPFVMTAANLLAAFVYARDLSRRDKFQIYGIALLFLALLYAATSALVLYWTLNNLYSLGANVLAPRHRSHRDAHWAEGAAQRVSRGALGNLAESFRAAAYPSIGAGFAFWLWTGAFALAGHNNQLDSGFISAIRQFGGQCVVTSFSASLVLASASGFACGRVSAGRVLSRLASVAFLFLLQLAFFAPGVAVTDGRFAFDMWDGRGTLFFALWALGIVAARRCGETARVWAAPLLRRSASRRTTVRKPLAPPVPNRRDTLFLDSLLGGVCALFLWLFIPFSTFFHNVNEFEFGARELLANMPPYILATFLLLTFFFFGASCLLPWECVRLPGRRTATGGKVTLVHTLALVFLAGVLIEGTVLSYKLPRLTGEKDLFDSILRLCVDTAIWLNLLIIGIRCWRWLATRFNAVLFFLALFSVTALADSYRSKEEKIDPAAYKESVNGLYLVDQFTFYSNYCFSKTDNTIIILVDSLDTLAFEKTLELYPDLVPFFDGFSLFRENLAAGGHTMTAMPQVFHGKIYDGSVSIHDFTQASLRGEQSMAADALKRGSKVFMHFLGWHIMSSDSEIDANYSYRKIDVKNYINTLFFRFLPYVGKILFEDAVNFKDKTMDRYLIDGKDVDTIRFNNMIDRIPHVCNEPVFQFVYFTGVHPPFIKDDLFRTARNFILSFSRVIQSLKDFNLYEHTTIVLMADHGLESYDNRYLYPERMGKYRTVYFPLLMVKPAGATGPMTIREDLTSSIDVRPLLQNFYTLGSNNAVMEQYMENLPDVRYMYVPEEGKLEARGSFGNMTLEKVEP